MGGASYDPTGPDHVLCCCSTRLTLPGSEYRKAKNELQLSRRENRLVECKHVIEKKSRRDERFMISEKRLAFTENSFTPSVASPSLHSYGVKYRKTNNELQLSRRENRLVECKYVIEKKSRRNERIHSFHKPLKANQKS
jgi:hypothetical protein